MIDVALAIDAEAISVLHRRRSGAGTYTAGGKYTPATFAPQAIRATVQPASGRGLRDMPEGLHDEAKFFIWSRFTLLLDDQIVYAGTSWRVIFVWPRPVDGFCKAAIGELKA